MRVLKWPVHVDDDTPQQVGGGTIVHVGLDPAHGGRPDHLAVWTEEIATPTSPRAVTVHGTGQEIPTSRMHVGSVVVPPYVWHIYEL